jgi:hypothetical protein
MYRSSLTKRRKRFNEAITGIMIFIFATSSCTPTPPAPNPPVDPILYAVVVPGNPPTFARQRTSPSGQGYEGYEILPSSSVILRLTNPFPKSSEAIKIILKYKDGTQSDRLQYVRVDDIPQQRSLESIGYYEVVVDSYGYSVIVVPPATERTGSGFDIIMTNIASNPPAGVNAESKALDIVILRQAANRTKPSDVFFDCGDDFQAIDGDWHYNCKEGASIVLRNFTLEGWLVSLNGNCIDGGSNNAFKKLCIEDYLYDFIPNSDFIDAFYGPNGMFSAINGNDSFVGVKLPGDLAQPANGQLSFEDIALSTGKLKGVNINSFILPRNGVEAQTNRIHFHSELNAWHVNDQGCTSCRHWKGRGEAPSNWFSGVGEVPTNDPYYDAWANTRWPYMPENPDGGATNLQPGTYVRMNGTLWQDASHEGSGPLEPWEAAFPGQGGWLEIHPIDWIERVPEPTLRKTPILVQNIFIPPSSFGQEKIVILRPDRPKLPGEVLRCRELIDDRFTTKGIQRYITISPQQVAVSVTVAGPDGRFKAVYLVWWEQGSTPDTTCPTVGGPAAEPTKLPTQLPTQLPAKVEVPDVLGMYQAPAEQAIHVLGLVPAHPITDPTGPQAWVWSQSPSPGTLVNSGSTVTLRLKTGPKP